MKFYQTAQVTNGRIKYDIDRAKNLISNLYDGTYLVSLQLINPKSTEKDYRAAYFAKLDILAADTGHTRYEMHDLVKEYVLHDMMQQLPEFFGNKDLLSTKNLSLQGWPVLLERLDLWAFTEYNVILQ